MERFRTDTTTKETTVILKNARRRESRANKLSLSLVANPLHWTGLGFGQLCGSLVEGNLFDRYLPTEEWAASLLGLTLQSFMMFMTLDVSETPVRQTHFKNSVTYNTKKLSSNIKLEIILKCFEKCLH